MELSFLCMYALEIASLSKGLFLGAFSKHRIGTDAHAIYFQNDCSLSDTELEHVIPLGPLVSSGLGVFEDRSTAIWDPLVHDFAFVNITACVDISW